jgi:hypothetical protein
MVGPGTKRCPRCGEWLPFEAFRENPRARSGLDSWCQVCHVDATRAWRAANPEKVAASNAARRVERGGPSVGQLVSVELVDNEAAEVTPACSTASSVMAECSTGRPPRREVRLRELLAGEEFGDSRASDVLWINDRPVFALAAPKPGREVHVSLHDRVPGRALRD